MVINYKNITAQQMDRANHIIKKITDGDMIGSDDAEFYAAYCAAVAAMDIELQAQVKAIEDEATERLNASLETENAMRSGFNTLVNAALARYERVRGEMDNV